jgi:peptidoglycan/xylan/chitin deacetylase (PgdA/CDA1 family)
MRAVLVVFLLLGAFLSVASMHKVFSVEESPVAIQSVSIDVAPIPYLSTLSASRNSSSSALSFNSFLETIPTASPAAITPPASDFCLDVPVFLYHHTQPLEMATLLGHPQLTVDSNIFDEQMRYLVENGYNVVSAEALVEALLNRQQLPPKTVLVTIDDGYDDNYTYAFATAKKYKIVMNFMIPTELIGRPGYMTWDHLKEMAVSPYAKIYNHTATHAALEYITPEQIETELTTSSTAFREQLGLSNTIFTYPYGAFNDYAVEQVKKHGFIGAFSTIEGTAECLSQIMVLPRFRIGNAPMSFYGF